MMASGPSRARALGMSRPMVSRYLEQMESWAGARLIHRSTRRLTLTPAGEKVLLKTRGLTRIADEIAGERQRADPSGTLRVACAHFTAMQLISPLLPDFLARYPLLNSRSSALAPSTLLRLDTRTANVASETILLLQLP